MENNIFFYTICKLYTMFDFQQTFDRLTHDAHEVLANIGHTKWTRAYFPNICWNIINIDIPQFLLGLLVNQLNVPIITVTEVICELTTVHTLYAEIMLQRMMQKSAWWQATKIPPKISSNIYQVFDFEITCVLNLNRHTCSYGKWHSLGISCRYAIMTSCYSNIIELANVYQTDLFRTTYQTQNMHHIPPPFEQITQVP
uniref:Uncharacterized protein n=1 Tax=Lactuca sativa TaxID=4236 RepID=A0A9R1WGU6_LACSA|nr:hypothetical protein LSAT_V11C200080150 [Lactuca sativa]